MQQFQSLTPEQMAEYAANYLLIRSIAFDPSMERAAIAMDEMMESLFDDGKTPTPEQIDEVFAKTRGLVANQAAA